MKNLHISNKFRIFANVIREVSLLTETLRG
nr:MAG TPA: hypothetical protein [Caudoviricetes sp.]DAN10737.1 MAG TPA: hypothetical protein [Bacteriophage sp.]DAG42206.1 MAG TPA: hypothetical protein [Caudoviricetes sp.]DAG71301.1 MAG TPA: hypothetical protein [Caudoviricetes sp.]DAG83604.1 MAG TPA: hypothetical protein [Caudoviricetes sp.]